MGSLVKKGIVKEKRGRIKKKDRGNIAPTAAVWENTKLNIIMIRDGGKEKQKQDTVE